MLVRPGDTVKLYGSDRTGEVTSVFRSAKECRVRVKTSRGNEEVAEVDTEIVTVEPTPVVTEEVKPVKKAKKAKKAWAKK